MTQLETSTPTLSLVTSPARVDVPAAPPWAVSRPKIADRLDRGMSGVLTVVRGPSGAGKSMAVADWAATADVSGGVVWLSLAGIEGDPDTFWHLLRQGLVEAGARGRMPLPSSVSTEGRRTRLLAELGSTLGATGPWVVVLDDYPTGPPGTLERQLQTLLDHAHRGLRLVVLSRGDPRIPVHRQAAAGELTTLDWSDLQMNCSEVAQVLRAHGVDDSPATVRTVERRTSGWVCGVHLAAVALQTAPTVEEAMQNAEEGMVDFLAHEVLAELPLPVRDLIVRTSVADVVDRTLAQAILGPDTRVAMDTSLTACHLVDLRPDGTFRCHPLLRAAAAAQLSSGPPEVARAARRAAARVYSHRGETRISVELAMAAGDWSQAASAIVESGGAIALMAGAADPVVSSALRVDAVTQAEPLLLAADALARRNVEAAELALQRVAPTHLDPSPPLRLCVTLAQLMMGRLTAEPSKAHQLAADGQRILAGMTLPAERQEQIDGLLSAQTGALFTCAGDLQRAAVALARGARGSAGSVVARSARADCAGWLALVEALSGNLLKASHQAQSLLSDRSVPDHAGLLPAHLAMASVHVDRHDLASARQRLALVRELDVDPEPFLAALTLVLESRLAIAEGRPEIAARLLTPAVSSAHSPSVGQPAVDDMLVDTLAEALLSMGEPARALALVRSEPVRGGVGAALVTAAALSELGDGTGARAALEAAAEDVARAPLGRQLEGWLLEAHFASDDGDVDRARRLVDRALRVGEAEELRRPFVEGSTWLRRFVVDEVVLQRVHSVFLASLLSTQGPRGAAPSAWAEDGLIVETLTAREAEVLGLIAEMFSTDEIAAQLFLSVNTIKTYVRGILRKLCVNRRVDAVRRGRELGLC